MNSQIEKDPLYEKAKLVARGTNRLCVANIQRTLLIGYNRANRLMESMIEDGVVEKYESAYGGFGYKLKTPNA